MAEVKLLEELERVKDLYPKIDLTVIGLSSFKKEFYKICDTIKGSIKELNLPSKNIMEKSVLEIINVIQVVIDSRNIEGKGIEALEEDGDDISVMLLNIKKKGEEVQELLSVKVPPSPLRKSSFADALNIQAAQDDAQVKGR